MSDSREFLFPEVNGEAVPHEIEMVELRKSHLGREVLVSEPDKPTWHGIVDGWDPDGVFVKVAPRGARHTIRPEHLSWEV